VDRGWYPTLTELDVGYVEQGGQRPRWSNSDEDFIRYHMRWKKMTEEQAQEALRASRNRKWVADVAGLMLVSSSRFRNLRLDRFWNDAKRVIPYYLTWLCEVKVQRSDFLKDDKFEKPPQAHLQFLATPKGLIAYEEIPAGWGLLEVQGKDEYGARIYKTMDRCVLHDDLPEETGRWLAEQMVWTMWWRHRGEAHRDFYRKSVSEQVTRDANKVSNIIRAVVKYIGAESTYLERENRGTLEEYLKLDGIRRRVASWTKDQAEELREELQRWRGSKSVTE